MRPVRAAAVLVIAAACGGNSAIGRGLPGLDDGLLTARTDLRERERELAATIRESYRALSGGFEEAYLDGLARDKRLVLIDVGPEDVVIGFDPIACRARRQFDDRRIEIVSKALEVQVSEDGSVGWAYDEISYRVQRDGRRAIIPMRVTSVHEHRGGRWLLVQEHVSYGIPDAELFADPAFRQRPAALGNFTAPGPVAAELRELFTRLAVDTDDAARDHVSTRTGALVLGSDPDREVRGAAIADTPTVRALYGYDYRVALRELRVKVGVTGTSAWAAANVEVRGPGPGGGEVAVPLRVTWVATREDGTWRVVQTHVSAAVPKETLSLRVFGDALASRSGARRGAPWLVDPAGMPVSKRLDSPRAGRPKAAPRGSPRGAGGRAPRALPAEGGGTPPGIEARSKRRFAQRTDALRFSPPTARRRRPRPGRAAGRALRGPTGTCR